MKNTTYTVFCVFLFLSLASSAATTISTNHHMAFSANTGWVDAGADITNGACIGQWFCTGLLWNANCGWIHLGRGPANGWRYSNTNQDWGVNHDAEGHLSGYAYGANIGWITFEQTYGKPVIDLRSGNLSGYIWSANIGWMSLSNAQARIVTSSLDSGFDSDADGIPDPWEYKMVSNLTALAGGLADADGDGVSDRDEYRADTDPLDNSDSFEILTVQTASTTNHVVFRSKSTRQYWVETSESIDPQSWTNPVPGLIDPPQTAVYTQAVSGVQASGIYYRVGAKIPLSD